MPHFIWFRHFASKKTSGTETSKNTHFFFRLAFFPKLPSVTAQPVGTQHNCKSGQLRHRELDNIIVEQQDPHELTWARSSWTRATSEPWNIKKSSFMTPLCFFWGYLKHSDTDENTITFKCPRRGLNVGILRSVIAQGENSALHMKRWV